MPSDLRDDLKKFYIFDLCGDERIKKLRELGNLWKNLSSNFKKGLKEDLNFGLY